MEAGNPFRRGNDAIADAVRRFRVRDAEVSFICECVDADCFASVPLTLEEYRALREAGVAVALVDHEENS